MERKEMKEKIIALIDCANIILDKNVKVNFVNLLQTKKIEARICSECGDIMIEGYCIEDGEAYYCKDECRDKNMTKEEYNKLYDKGNGDSYWTSWINYTITEKYITTAILNILIKLI